MKIRIRNKEGFPKRLGFFIPTSLIKSKFAWKVAIKNSEGEAKEELLKIQPVVLECYKALKNTIKENGHFNLVEVETNETYVVIRL